VCQSNCPRYVWSVTEESTVVADNGIEYTPSIILEPTLHECGCIIMSLCAHKWLFSTLYFIMYNSLVFDISATRLEDCDTFVAMYILLKKQISQYLRKTLTCDVIFNGFLRVSYRLWMLFTTLIWLSLDFFCCIIRQSTKQRFNITSRPTSIWTPDATDSFIPLVGWMNNWSSFSRMLQIAFVENDCRLQTGGGVAILTLSSGECK